jgi:hypothetical protein
MDLSKFLWDNKKYLAVAMVLFKLAVVLLSLLAAVYIWSVVWVLPITLVLAEAAGIPYITRRLAVKNGLGRTDTIRVGAGVETISAAIDILIITAWMISETVDLSHFGATSGGASLGSGMALLGFLFVIVFLPIFWICRLVLRAAIIAFISKTTPESPNLQKK